MTLIFSSTRDDLYRASSIMNLGGSVILNFGELHHYGFIRNSFRQVIKECLIGQPVILADRSSIQRYSDNHVVKFLLEKFMGKGLTVVDSNPRAGYEGIGMYAIDNRELGILFSTLKEEIIAYEIKPGVELHDAIAQLSPDAVVAEYPRGEIKGLTVIRVTGYSLQLIRPGNVSLSDIEGSLKGLFNSS